MYYNRELGERGIEIESGEEYTQGGGRRESERNTREGLSRNGRVRGRGVGSREEYKGVGGRE